MSGGRRGGMPQGQGSKVGWCEKVSNHASVRSLYSTDGTTIAPSDSGSVVRTDGKIVFPGRDNSLSGSAESEYCRREILMIEPLVSRPLRAVLPVLGVGIFACGWREVLVRPNVLHVGCAWRCRSSLSGCYLPVPLAGVPMQRGEADWRPVLQPLRRLQQR